jgi:hypothetical protein
MLSKLCSEWLISARGAGEEVVSITGDLPARFALHRALICRKRLGPGF